MCPFKIVRMRELIFYSTSTFLKRIDALRWTSHMEECLNILAESKECPGDAVLVHQVRLQLLVEQASQISQQIRESGNATPLDLYRRSLQGQLQEVNDKLPPELNFNRKSAQERPHNLSQ